MTDGGLSFQIKVLHVSPECSPLAKRGGLGDVAGSLPKALNGLSADARVLMPAWPGVLESARELGALNEIPLGAVSVALDWRAYVANVYEACVDGVVIYLLDQPELFSDPDIYTKTSTAEDARPFIFLSYSAFELPTVAEWKPHFIHAHDWGTAVIPAALRWHKYYSRFKSEYDTIFTIHNAAYQGIFPPDALSGWGFKDSAYSTLNTETMEYYGQANLMKGAILSCDAFTTVSPRYSWDIQLPEFGFGLDGVISANRDKFTGILNGIDYDVWDPKKDRIIASKYSKTNTEGKARCREALFEACNWEDDGRPVVIFVGRLVNQKGIDIMLQALPYFVQDKIRMVIVGSGSDFYNRKVMNLAEDYPGSVFTIQRFSEKAAHMAYAGGDIMLMPSAFEPCGLSQLIAFKYGTVPVVRATGGLADTVIDADSCPDGTGFVFSEYSSRELSTALTRALDAMKDEKRWRKIVYNAMNADFSWETSAKAYADLYSSVLTGEHQD